MGHSWRTVTDGDRTFVTIGAVAEALRRDVQTIRRFEREGVLPKPTYRLMSPHLPGQRRLYTPEQVRSLERAAWATGLVGEQRPSPREIEDFARRARVAMATALSTESSSAGETRLT